MDYCLLYRTPAYSNTHGHANMPARHGVVHAEASDQCQTYLGTPSFLAITRRVAHLILQCNHTIAYMQVRFAFRFPTPAMSTTLDHTP